MNTANIKGPTIKYDCSKLLIQLISFVSVVYYILNIIFPTDYSQNADNANRIYPQLAAAAIFCLSILIIALNYSQLKGNAMMICSSAILLMSAVYIVYPLNVVPNLLYVMRSYTAIVVMLALFVLLIQVKDISFWENHIALIFIFQLLFGLFSLVTDKISAVQTGEELFDSNSGFILVSCLPMALVFPYKRLRVYLYCLVVLACIYTGQRSAALAASISFLPAFPILRRNLKRIDITILLVAFLVIAVPVLGEALQNIQDRNAYDMSKGNIGSGRLVFWGIVLKDFVSHDIFHIIFGNGTNSVAAVLDEFYGIAIGAHNGWLDFLYTFGIVGLSVYAAFFVVLLKNAFACWYKDRYYSYFSLLMFIVFFIKASTSHGFFDISMIPYMMALAYAEGMKMRNDEKDSLHRAL